MKGTQREPDVGQVLLMEKLGYALQDLAAEVDGSATKPLYALKEWMQTAEGKEKTVNPIPSLGIQRSYVLATKYLGKANDADELAKGLARFGRGRMTEVTVQTKDRVTFGEYKAQIDSGMPVLLKLGETFVTGVGYWQNEGSSYLIVHDPVSSEIKVVANQGEAFASDHDGQKQGPLIPGCQFVRVGVATENMKMLAIMKWKRDFGDVRKATIDAPRQGAKP